MPNGEIKWFGLKTDGPQKYLIISGYIKLEHWINIKKEGLHYIDILSEET